MRRRDLTGLLVCSAVGSALAQAQARESPEGSSAAPFALTSAERAAAVTPASYAYPPGTPERYGAVGDGIADDTGALVTAIRCNDVLTFSPARTYGIQSVKFPRGRTFVVNFNGARLRGIASKPTDCIVKLETQGATFIAYDIDMNFNPHYACGTWWYDPASSAQYNTVFGMKHSYGVRGLIYGELPGTSSTGFAQSENSIYGFRTRGIQNPFYGNHANGVLFFSQPIFVANNEEWPHTPAFDWKAARAFENHAGVVHVDGGEIELAATTAGYAADLSNCYFQGSIIETSEPVRISGDFVHISGGRTFMTRDDQSQFYIQPAVRGALRFANVSFLRSSGLGAYSNHPLVDATAADATFEVCMNGTASVDWRWAVQGADVRLVKGAVARYGHHRMSITDSDSAVYVLNSTAASLLDGRPLDRFGYSTAGWYLHQHSGTAALTATTHTGPPGYLPAQLSLATTGTAVANHLDTTNPATLGSSALRVRPGETYMVAAQIRRSAGTDAGITAEFYTPTGQLLRSLVLADRASVTASWSDVQAPLAIPAGAGFLGLGIHAIASSVLWTDFRITRCS